MRRSASEIRTARWERGPARGAVPNGSLELKAGEIHLWRMDLRQNIAALPALVRTLPPNERANAATFRSAVDRDRYLLAHGGLRTILARYANTTPGDVVFRRGRRGKPEVADGPVHFSMSHSDDLVVIAISRDSPIGVDIERMQDGIDEELTRCFSPKVHRALGALPRAARRRAFFQAWTRMEAYAKARGDELESHLDALEVFLGTSDDVPGPLVGDGDRPGCWSLRDFSPRRGYAGALAAPRATWMLRFWKWRARDIAHAAHSISPLSHTEPGFTSVEQVTYEAV